MPVNLQQNFYSIVSVQGHSCAINTTYKHDNAGNTAAFMWIKVSLTGRYHDNVISHQTTKSSASIFSSYPIPDAQYTHQLLPFQHAQRPARIKWHVSQLRSSGSVILQNSSPNDTLSHRYGDISALSRLQGWFHGAYQNLYKKLLYRRSMSHTFQGFIGFVALLEIFGPCKGIIKDSQHCQVAFTES